MNVGVIPCWCCRTVASRLLRLHGSAFEGVFGNSISWGFGMEDAVQRTRAWQGSVPTGWQGVCWDLGRGYDGNDHSTPVDIFRLASRETRTSRVVLTHSIDAFRVHVVTILLSFGQYRCSSQHRKTNLSARAGFGRQLYEQATISATKTQHTISDSHPAHQKAAW